MKPIRALIMKKSFILGELISCMTCTGFWVMLVISFLMPTYVPTETYLPLHGVAAKIMNSLTGMTIITFVYIFILVIETHFKIDW